MKRITLTLLVVLAALLTVPAALAGNVHFVSASAFINSQGSLVCKFRLAGFGSTQGQETTVSCSSTVTLGFTCGDGSTQGYTTSSTGFDSFGNYTGNSGGSVVSPPLITYPNPCLGTLHSVGYSDVAITDSSIGSKSAYSIPGTFTRSF